ncbi:MAG: hypothetical protein OER12_09485 [Acidimicrobiia bacterium]|nr:hypothetical protein [Acidimicrobiia bacterium]
MSTRVIALLAVMGLILAACGDGDTSDPLATTTSVSAPTTTAVATTTTLPDTTTTAPATTSTTVPATTTTTRPPPPAGGYVVVEASIFPAEPLPNSGGAGGSGCAPGPGELPDGIWYGTVLAANGDSVDFDLACFYFGDIAYEIGAAAGVEVYNDYFISDENPAIRTVPVGGQAMVWSIPGDLGDLVPLSFATDWPPDWQRAYSECPGEFCGMWLYINQGTATELVEQYVP